MRIPARHHRGADPWGRDSYRIPGCAVLGASDTGSWSDSPCPTKSVKSELGAFRSVLRAAGIRSRWGGSSSGNVFCGKRWVLVAPSDWPRGIELADQYLRENDAELVYAHDARS